MNTTATKKCKKCSLTLTIREFTTKSGWVDYLCPRCRLEWSNGQNKPRKRRAELLTDKELHRVAETAAAKVKKNSPLTFIELKQEAYKAILESRDTFKPEYGTPFTAFAHQAAVYACTRISYRHLKVAAKEALEEQTPDSEVQPEVDLQMWRERVRKELELLLTDQERVEVLPVLLHEVTAVEVASEQGVHPRIVYKATSDLRRRLASSSALTALWKERR